MSSFKIEEHAFEGQHIRQYPAALANSQEDAVRLHAKSYTPNEVASGQAKGDLTVIGFHANGLPKETYEPFFDYLYQCLKQTHGLTIGSIWIADFYNQGESALLNDEILGNDPHWFDHARDVLLMVNTFRAQMRRPIVAIGHSMGGAQAVAAAHFHPRLFEAAVFVDSPMTMMFSPTIAAMHNFIMSKPETFASKDEAIQFVRRHPFFKTWHKDALQRYIDTAFHDGESSQHPAGTVNFKTSPHAEARSNCRPNLNRLSVDGVLEGVDRYTHPDVHLRSPFASPFYNPFTREAYAYLGSLRPPAQFILGKGSKIAPPGDTDLRTKFTGTQAGGSGGINAGNVEEVIVPGGHFLPLTNPQGTAEAAAGFLAKRIRMLTEVEGQFSATWNKRSLAEKQRLTREESEMYRSWNGKPWDNRHALPDGGRSKL